MARSFLFAQDDADSATTRLITTAAQVTGFMKGEPGAARPGWYRPGGDNADFMAQLYQALATTYPAAGPAFWAVRLWTNLIWQPAYLAVIGTHIHNALPDLDSLSQQRRGIYVDGYRLVPGAQSQGDVAARIERASGQLKVMSARLHQEVNAVAKLRHLPAQRLLADRMLSLMVWLRSRQPTLSVDTVVAYSEAWMAALGLSSQGQLETVRAPDGRALLIVKRKGCCLDYLIDPTRLCASCPKQDNALRVARQSANALAELD
ncbi:siderophore ferric iron reductase [Devosia sp. BSSL-BM10]|uniref:Siderophore ferric iron reductase n=1 Tax=Devosia litorisediminis TaxID=2829817 RepID=A0A942I7C7_9HYPH|nr:siderophore ferric iron reductase [Devosia litorisediminis]MBS3850582.1 siderophore ferric iron reductase [Devosia litorisediminis]